MPESPALLCRRGRAGSCAGWCCGEPCEVVLREAMRGGPEGCDGRRAILHCSNEGIHEGFPAAIPKSGPEIKNHCSIWADSEENLAAIPKSKPEIKNHCSRGLVAVCRRNHSPSQQRRIESDAEDCCRNGRCRRAILLRSNED